MGEARGRHIFVVTDTVCFETMEDINALKALGLTEYAARTYVALVGLGAASATAVAEASQVPRTKIYAVLDELVKKNWVEPGTGRPKTFTAMDPALRIEEGRRVVLDELATTQTRLAALYQQDGVQFAGPMWVLTGAGSVQRRLTRMISEAKTEVFVGLPWLLPGDDELIEVLGKVARSGVHVRVLLSPGAAEAAPRLRALPVELRHGMAPLRAHFADARQGLVCFRKGTEAPYAFRGIWNPHAEMVAQLREMGDMMWQAAGTRPPDDGPHASR